MICIITGEKPTQREFFPSGVGTQIEQSPQPVGFPADDVFGLINWLMHLTTVTSLMLCLLLRKSRFRKNDLLNKK